MSWLHNLLGIEAPDNASLHVTELNYRGLFPPWFALLLVVVACAGVFYLYAHERTHLSQGRRTILALLRTAVIGLVLFLLLRPVLVAGFHGERPQGVVLLIDNTESMSQRDRRLSAVDRQRVAIAEGTDSADTVPRDGAARSAADPTRAQMVRAVLTNPRLGLLPGLQSKGPLRTFLFGQRLRHPADDVSVSATADPLDRLLAGFRADETRTALADSINELLVRNGTDLPAAVVVMTDGQDNASKLTLADVARECARLKVPLHFYGVGSAEGGTLQLKDVAVPETVFAEDAVPVPVRWRSRGFRTGTFVITLTQGGKVVGQPREVPVREGDDLRQVLTFTPEKGGDEKIDLVTTIQLKGNPAVSDSIKRTVRVVDQKVRVFYVENSPRWEYKFIQPALMRDRRVEARFLLLNGDPQVMQAGPPFLDKFPDSFPEFESDKQKKPFDLLILGDVPASYLGPDRLKRIRDFVKEGGGLVLIAGREHAPAEYVETPLAEVLPVEFLPVKYKPEADARPQPFTPQLTLAGKHADMLALTDTPEENLRVWEKLPGFTWHYPVTRLRPGATTLLAHPKLKNGDKPMPIIATHYYGKGQVLFLGTDETWRWRYNAQDRYLARFWGQVIYQMSLPHLLGSSNRTQLALDRSDAILGRPGYVYARLLDAKYQPLQAKSVSARLEFLDAGEDERRVHKLELKAVPGQAGQYRAPLPNDVPGRFELKIDAAEGLEAGSLQYRVDRPPGHELEPLGMAESTLREAARISGGRFYREEDLHTLPDAIEPRRTPFVQRQEVLLWNPLALVVFVGLITAEWVVRKFSHLS